MGNFLHNMKMVVAYEGTNYSGFQRQPAGLPTIQGILEDKLALILKETVKICGAGRTDAGVHARGQVVSFAHHSAIAPEKLIKALNSVLPEDILVRSLEQVPATFQARYSAKSKTYSYRIFFGPLRPLFERNFVYHFRHRLDPDLMRQAADLLVGSYDFKGFQAAGSAIKNTVRTVNFCRLEQTDSEIKLVINADGFLYHMVRNIVGTLILVGNERLSLERFHQIIKERDRRLAGPTAPARGLCLEEVIY